MECGFLPGEAALVRLKLQWGQNRHNTANQLLYGHTSPDNLQEVGKGCGDWMELAHDRDRWRAFVSTVMNFRVP